MYYRLLILKHIRNLPDESVAEQWGENNNYQYFSENRSFNLLSLGSIRTGAFSHRIGQQGVELVFRESIRLMIKTFTLTLQSIRRISLTSRIIKLAKRVIKKVLELPRNKGKAKKRINRYRCNYKGTEF